MSRHYYDPEDGEGGEERWRMTDEDDARRHADRDVRRSSETKRARLDRRDHREPSSEHGASGGGESSRRRDSPSRDAGHGHRGAGDSRRRENGDGEERHRAYGSTSSDAHIRRGGDRPSAGRSSRDDRMQEPPESTGGDRGAASHRHHHDHHHRRHQSSWVDGGGGGSARRTDGGGGVGGRRLDDPAAAAAAAAPLAGGGGSAGGGAGGGGVGPAAASKFRVKLPQSLRAELGSAAQRLASAAAADRARAVDGSGIVGVVPPLPAGSPPADNAAAVGATGDAAPPAPLTRRISGRYDDSPSPQQVGGGRDSGAPASWDAPAAAAAAGTAVDSSSGSTSVRPAMGIDSALAAGLAAQGGISASDAEDDDPTAAAAAASGTDVAAAAGGDAAGTAADQVAASAGLPALAARHNPLLHGCRNVNCYRPLHKIEEGTYGVVFSAEEIATGARVALKKVKMGKLSTEFPITALRETNVLLMLQHENIVRVREMVVGSGLDKVYMVMDYYEHDVKMLMAAMGSQHFSQAEVKCLMLQLLRGTAYMHERWVLHRDMKTSNLLIDNEGRLCICDFGLARKYGSPLRPYTQSVVTLWYRAPEVLLGADVYGPAIDMWSVGCIFAEFVTKKPLLPGQTEAEQLERIFRLVGTPTNDSWPGWASLPLARDLAPRLKPRGPAPLRQELSLGLTPFAGAPFLSDAGLDLLRRCLTPDPARRITAADALRHPWFDEAPAPADRRLMPAFPSKHDSASAPPPPSKHVNLGAGAAAAAGGARNKAVVPLTVPVVAATVQK